MATCFLFASQLSAEGILSVKLNTDGHIIAPLSLRTIDEVKLLQADSNTVVVLQARMSSIHELELPWLGERKARAAIPYALEEQLAQNVAELHVAFDREHYHNGHYLVVVTDKKRLLDTIQILDSLALNFDALTVDWFAAQSGEACVTPYGLLVNEIIFKGFLNIELAKLFLASDPAFQIVYKFPESVFLEVPSSEVETKYEVWVAQRLLKTRPMNLCQGDLQRQTRKHSTRFWYQIAGILAGFWLLSFVVFNMGSLFFLNHKIAKLDEQTAVIYHEFFPQSRQVISPKFRISQLLKAKGNNNDTLWILLEKLGHAFSAKELTMEQYRYADQKLSLILSAKNFTALERLQRQLQREQVKVVQTNASSHDQQVNSTLELSL